MKVTALNRRYPGGVDLKVTSGSRPAPRQSRSIVRRSFSPYTRREDLVCRVPGTEPSHEVPVERGRGQVRDEHRVVEPARRLEQQPSARLEDPRGLGERRRRLVEMLRDHLVEDEIEGLVLERQRGRVCDEGLVEMGVLQDPRIQVDADMPGAAASKVEHVLVSSSRAGADLEHVHLRRHERGDLLLERILLVVRIEAQPQIPDRRPQALTGNRPGILSNGDHPNPGP